MNTPDWKDAPEWANWLAMDQDGEWYWFHNEPSLDTGIWVSATGKVEMATLPPIVRYESSLQERPQ